MVPKDMQLVFSTMMLIGLALLAYTSVPWVSTTLAMKPNPLSSRISGKSVSVPLLQEGSEVVIGKRNMKKKVSFSAAAASLNSKKLVHDFDCDNETDCVENPLNCPEDLCFCDYESYACGPKSNVCVFIEEECTREDDICPPECKCDYDNCCSTCFELS